jgi:hypothetical protein
LELLEDVIIFEVISLFQLVFLPLYCNGSSISCPNGKRLS